MKRNVVIETKCYFHIYMIISLDHRFLSFNKLNISKACQCLQCESEDEKSDCYNGEISPNSKICFGASQCKSTIKFAKFDDQIKLDKIMRGCETEKSKIESGCDTKEVTNTSVEFVTCSSTCDTENCNVEIPGLLMCWHCSDDS